MKYTPLLATLLTAITAAAAPPAFAQWSPSATANFGAGLGALSLSQGNLSLGRSELQRMNHPNPATTPSTAPPVTAPATTPSSNEAEVQAIWQKLRPEYEMRVRRDGQPAATAWLKNAAMELGRQRGMQARQALEPEYERRVQLYGKASANSWLAAKGRQMEADGAAAGTP